MHQLLFVCLLTLALFRVSLAFAACSSPTSSAGTLEWFSGTS